MKRLTVKCVDEPTFVPDNEKWFINDEFGVKCLCGEVVNRLADYEDVGIMPQDVALLQAENARLAVALQATIAEKERIRQLAVDYSCKADGLQMDLQMCQNMKLAREFENLLETTSIPVAVKKVRALMEVADAAKELTRGNNRWDVDYKDWHKVQQALAEWEALDETL